MGRIKRYKFLASYLIVVAAIIGSYFIIRKTQTLYAHTKAQRITKEREIDRIRNIYEELSETTAELANYKRASKVYIFEPNQIPLFIYGLYALSKQCKVDLIYLRPVGSLEPIQPAPTTIKKEQPKLRKPLKRAGKEEKLVKKKKRRRRGGGGRKGVRVLQSTAQRSQQQAATTTTTAAVSQAAAAAQPKVNLFTQTVELKLRGLYPNLLVYLNKLQMIARGTSFANLSIIPASTKKGLLELSLALKLWVKKPTAGGEEAPPKIKLIPTKPLYIRDVFKPQLLPSLTPTIPPAQPPTTTPPEVAITYKGPPLPPLPATTTAATASPPTTTPPAKPEQPKQQQQIAQPPPKPLPALVLSGIIKVKRGKEEYVVVRYQNEPYSLRLGDEIADGWKLTQIGTTTAVFVNADRSMEVKLD